MKVLHITPHLGGGVGKAHAAIQGATDPAVGRAYYLLEEPRDRRYADLVEQAGGRLHHAGQGVSLAELIEDADIVQIEWWNHPRLYHLLATTELPPMRSLFWAHVSGLFAPYIPTDLVAAAGRFVFTSPCSLQSPDIADLPEEVRARLGVVGSGFGFEDERIADAVPASETSAAIAYLGTVDFVKMHPAFFDIVDAVDNADIHVSVWGGFDPEGEPARRARAMRHPERVRLEGQTADPRAALQAAGIFFYPLREDHYGTAENALIEAMSLGLVPVVLANPAEKAIVTDGVNGVVAADPADMAARLGHLLAEPEERARLSAAARATARDRYQSRRSAGLLGEHYRALMGEPKMRIDFAGVLGSKPVDWFLSTQQRDRESGTGRMFAAGGGLSKGSIDHFLATFPDDPGLLSLSAR
ncbi:MAG: glycosyltransferase family 4 protein [Alphaproteobacteria bacterium]|nr:glycosyltransferase family 4 protein [Rhizobiaceae bacterium]MBU3964001.1 glycosyltransferase family 4 protein [Alphaproteobacteria bacterium]MBU4048197.1 glycosyltransferase family 4 protein [Alphaproteobacteria bacterium]MBU4089258.1 glycosyltransferase family 4 protein [Alphaproteobacteria bacterium]MBU4158732.1 glycosyltransferase family 4 protein [Alphaproteobacteria bacterium]